MTMKSKGPALAHEALPETMSTTPDPKATDDLKQATQSDETGANHHLSLVGNTASDDPFDLAKLRIPQDFLETTAVKKLLTTVPVGKPSSQSYFRIHPAPNYRATLAFLDLKEERETYLVSLADVPELQPECYIANLFTGITRSGVLFMWPVRVPAADGRVLDWHVSAAAGAANGMTRWTKIKANMDLRAYEISEAEGKIPDPVWPSYSFAEIYRIAFRDRLINSVDHPVIKRLRGA